MECESESECRGLFIFFISVMSLIFIGIVVSSIHLCIYGEEGSERRRRYDQRQREIEMVEAGGFVDHNFIPEQQNIEIGGI